VVLHVRRYRLPAGRPNWTCNDTVTAAVRGLTPIGWERPAQATGRRAAFHAWPQSFPSFPAKSLTSASSTPLTTPSPIDAALPVIWAFVWMWPPLSFRSNVIVALA
jgi:hypothetical protein